MPHPATPTAIMTVDEHPPLLVPTPKALLLTGGWRSVGAFSVAGHPEYLPAVRAVLDQIEVSAGTMLAGEPFTPVTCAVAIEPLRNPEAYRLTITDTRILIESDHARGAAHAARTLAQLRAQYTDRLPLLRVMDRPAFAVRGVMLDISRDRVPTMDHLFATVDLLASWKINHLQLYTEHTFAYAGHETAWAGWSPMTPDEMRALDAHCAVRGIELVANQNCFGHLERWFAHATYAEMAEIQGVDTPWSFNGFHKRGPFSLCPGDTRSLPFVADLLGQLAPCVKSGLFNIGCDETYDLGQGRSRAAVTARGRAAVYLDFVAAVCGEVKKLGKRPMFWADIALEHPEALAQLPADLIGLAWGYEADADFGPWCRQLQAAGRDAWVCPGTSSWRSITGRTTERRANLLAAAQAGIAAGAAGFLVTDWGDNGHRQQWPVTLQALCEAAHRAWSGESAYDARAASLHAFGDRGLAIGPWLDRLGDCDADLRSRGGKPLNGAARPLRNASALFVDLHTPLGREWIGSPADWQMVEDRLNTLFADLPRNLAPLFTHEILHSLEEAAVTARRAVLRRQSRDDRSWHAHQRASWLRQIERHRSLWLERSRPGGLANSCAHYQAVIDELA